MNRLLLGFVGGLVTTTALALPADATVGPATDPRVDPAVDPVRPAVPKPGPASSKPQQLAADPSLWRTADGSVFAADLWPHADEPEHADEAEHADETDQAEGTAAQAEPTASYSLAETFVLHSRPGALRTIYLDFDGGVLDSGNAWLERGAGPMTYPGWSTDGSASFSDAERTVIQQVWARVAEDYAPFEVDVTTEEPPASALWRSSSSDTTYGSRVGFTSSSDVQDMMCGQPCGGIAWVGTFPDVTSGETRNPAWVFPGSLGNAARTMADAASHEVGHNLGLGHDGIDGGSYYGGTSLWGPIMGSPYNAAIAQWSRGSYAGATNTEDDLAEIVRHGLAVRADEAGSSPATATPLASLSGGTGVVADSTDEDWIELTGCTGTVTVTAAPAAVGPNLDLRLALRDATGALLTSNAPATFRSSGGVTGLGAAVSLPLDGGPFYAVVAGGGSGAEGASGWSDGGYDAYGSLGAYRLSVAGCATTAPPPPTTTAQEPEGPNSTTSTTQTPTVGRPGRTAPPLVARGKAGGRLTIKARWSPPQNTGGAPIDGYRLTILRLDRSGRVVARIRTAVLPASTRRANLPLRSGRYVVRVKAHNRAGWSGLSRRSAVVRPR